MTSNEVNCGKRSTIATLIFSVIQKNTVQTVLESMDTSGESAEANGFLSSSKKYRSAQSAMSVKELQPNNMQQQLFSLVQQLETKPVPNFASSTGAAQAYSPSSNAEVSSVDQSPQIPVRILKAEDSAERKMKRLRRRLKNLNLVKAN